MVSMGNLCSVRLLLLCAATSEALVGLQLSRRHAVGCASAMAARQLLAPLAAHADLVFSGDKFDRACKDCTSVYAGTFNDERTGGTRTVTLLKDGTGPVRFARVTGGGGKGEPTSFELPALVKLDDSAFILNMSPRGPSDFTGSWTGDGIQFPPTPKQLKQGITTGNKWLKVQ